MKLLTLLIGLNFLISASASATRGDTVGLGWKPPVAPADAYEKCVDEYLAEDEDLELSAAEEFCSDHLDGLPELEADKVWEKIRGKHLPGSRDGSNIIPFPEKNARTQSDLNILNNLRLLKGSNLELTTEDLLVTGGILGAAAIIIKYGRSLNPLGMFFLGLGVSPVAASDYCSLYSGEQGFNYFINELSIETQFQEIQICPELAEKVLNVAF